MESRDLSGLTQRDPSLLKHPRGTTTGRNNLSHLSLALDIEVRVLSQDTDLDLPNRDSVLVFGLAVAVAQLIDLEKSRSPRHDQDRCTSIEPQDLAPTVSALVKATLSELGLTKDPPKQKEVSQKSPSLRVPEVIWRGKVSQQDDSYQEGNPMLDCLLLSAEERQDYEAFASPQSMG